MTDLDNRFGPNSGYVQELYKLFLLDENLVGEQWTDYFRSLNGDAQHLAPSHVSTNGSQPENRDRGFLTSRGQRFLDSVRQFGHLDAKINPLTKGIVPLPVPESIQVDSYGFTESERLMRVPCDGMAGKMELSLGQLVQETQRRYQGPVGFEYWHIHHDEERHWIQQRIEEPAHIFVSSPTEQKERLKKLIEAESLEAGLHTRYIGAKRFSLEGGDTLVPMLTTLLGYGAQSGVTEVVFGMAHRGRLNVLINVLGKSLEDIFAEFEDKTAATVVGLGDVKYHIGFYGEVHVSPEITLKARLCPNPSHLEFVNPVVAGATRALQDYKHDSNMTHVLPVLIHGDAAMIGQGVVAETINLSQVNGYRCGGTVHFVINNQIGFTSTPDESRSSSYATDLAKGLGIPVFHVNGEAVDEACEVVKLAYEYRQKFKKDVVIDLICYRKYGHNEGDDPTFTQPAMYSEIRNKKPISVQYNEYLLSQGVIDESAYDTLKAEYIAMFNDVHEDVSTVEVGEACGLSGKLVPTTESIATSVPLETLKKVARALVTFPEGFVPHPKLQKLMEKRVQAVEENGDLDWGAAENLAFGTLLLDGVDIRLSGQDSCRGTFSQRHIVYDHYGPETYKNGDDRLYPLRSLNSAARFEVYNSTLSEAGVLGFEYGYASVANTALVMWEAQFGDFSNGAQVIIDQFLAASEAKWNERSGLVLLLPHGYEGQGPEHSSARLERFLQLCAGGNMTVCYPSTSGQYFHMLRRHALTDVKRPLIVMTPKSLLRLPEASSTPTDLSEGIFRRVIETELGRKGDVVAFCTGKIYHDVLKALKEAQVDEGVSLVRIEQLYPFPAEEVTKILRKHEPKAVLWVQEEPQNMGAWNFVEPHLRALTGVLPQYVGRTESPSTATGSPKFHHREQGAIVGKVIEQVEAVSAKKAKPSKKR